MRGNSFANGPTPYRWLSGYQAPPPVTIYHFTEPPPGDQC